MAAINDNRELGNDSVCVAVTPEENNNGDVDNDIQSVATEDKRKRKRFPYRPYASPTNRIIKKCGKYNVLNINIPQKHTRYFKDLGNTLLSIRWRWILLSLCVVNAVIYVIFTILWMIMVAWEESYMDEGNKSPCIIGSSSFSSYLVLVIETITTIGSGSIYPTDCQTGWIMITLQALAGVAVEGALVTAVFVKMSRPHTRDTTKHFSKKAVICLREGVFCLIFRIQDIQGKYWGRTIIKAVLIRKRDLSICGSAPHYFQNLKLEKIGLMMWPQEIVHKITEESPFWSMSRYDFCKCRLEIMIVLEGDSLTTGQPSQSQTSYTNKEIIWGHRFTSCVEYDDFQQKYVINDEMFNNVVKCDMPECSPEDLNFVPSNEMKL